ncbi:MAG: hypothetical protein AAGF12_32535, partial [Myxococcota bacterium]
SLGVIAWEMLSGRSLFRRETNLETMYAVTRDPVPRLAGERPHVSDAVDQVIQRALSRTADQRQESAREFGRELLSAAGSSASAADVSEWMDTLFPGEQARRRSFVAHAMELRPERRSHKRVWVALGTVALLGAAGVTAYAVSGGNDGAAQTVSEAEGPVSEGPASPPPEPPPEPAAAEPPDLEVSEVTADDTNESSGDRASETSTADLRPGQLNLVTPGASSEVLYRGRSFGWTPLSKRLPAGVYSLTIRAPGGDAKRVRVRIRPNATTRRTVRFD